MIKSFKDREAERIFNELSSRKLSGDIQNVALRKLLLIDAAAMLSDLSALQGQSPGNTERAYLLAKSENEEI